METIKNKLKLFFSLENFSNGLLIFAITWLLTVLVRELIFLISINQFIWSIVGTFIVFLVGYLFNNITALIKDENKS